MAISGFDSSKVNALKKAAQDFQNNYENVVAPSSDGKSIRGTKMTACNFTSSPNGLGDIKNFWNQEGIDILLYMAMSISAQV